MYNGLLFIPIGPNIWTAVGQKQQNSIGTTSLRPCLLTLELPSLLFVFQQSDGQFPFIPAARLLVFYLLLHHTQLSDGPPQFADGVDEAEDDEEEAAGQDGQSGDDECLNLVIPPRSDWVSAHHAGICYLLNTPLTTSISQVI